MHFISGTEAGFGKAAFSRVSRYRHQVFVETLGWTLDTAGGQERDQFDRPDTVYVAAEDEDGHVVGCARLLPTHLPYLLADVFPQLLEGLPVPRSAQVWELSRFAAIDFHSQSTAPLQQLSSPAAVRLLQEAIDCAAALGARRLITVSPIGIERLLRRAGFEARRAGPPTIVDGHPLFACWIEVNPMPLRSDGSIPRPYAVDSRFS
jgi:N-acyl-L-homoserine lactone synthetase